jgi:hypothetical protein
MATTVSDRLALKDDEGLLVGTLRKLDDGTYEFEYVSHTPTMDVPFLDYRESLIHHSERLWPWFLNRIPNRKSPMFQRFADRLGLSSEDCQDSWILLAKMGKRSIKDWMVIEEPAA